MRILIIGANGFIGSYITAKLLETEHEIICSSKDEIKTKLKFPNTEFIHCDFNSNTTLESWITKLHNIDIVINAAGLLTSKGKNKIENVHIYGPIALFNACISAGVKRIIHISALGIDNEKTTDYALTKAEADQYLQNLDNIDWVILKPSLVYANGCYGGTSLLRGFASLPFIPLIGDGTQQFQPIHMDDLTEVVKYCVDREDKIQKVLNIVGPDVVSVKDIIANFRKWMGLKPTKFIKIPLAVIKIFTKFGDWFGIGPLNSTSFKMMIHPNIADKEELTNFTSITPRKFVDGVTTDPLTLQSLWHARLFILKPFARIILGAFWISTGLITLTVSKQEGLEIIESMRFGEQVSIFILYITSILDVILGTLLLVKKKTSFVLFAQLSMIIAYSFTIAIFKPIMWLDPLGSVLKNIPIIFLTLILIAIDEDR